MLTRPRVLTIAGSDPSGGAGIQADLKTFHAFGCYGMAVITALTAQNTRGVRGVHAVPAEFVAAQIAAVFDDCPPAAVKTGMLHDAAVVHAVADALAAHAVPLVVDPVMVSTSGHPLLARDAQRAMVERLFPLATVVTPNGPEAQALTGIVALDEESTSRAIAALHEVGARAVLLKGGHLPDDDAEDGRQRVVDRLSSRDGQHAWYHERVVLPAPVHGAGCTLSAAIAALLAWSPDLPAAVEQALDFVSAGIAAAYPVGAGAIPLDHHARPREPHP